MDDIGEFVRMRTYIDCASYAAKLEKKLYKNEKKNVQLSEKLASPGIMKSQLNAP